jgi:DNA topoisomerase-2
VLDGLKPSQRKILFGCFKRNLKSEIRVAQLAGYVSEHAAYHHGEASLNSTITSMAQLFVGANNINLLAPIGQFGSRLMGGKDAASPRYIHTHLEPIVDRIFRKEDAPILQHLEDDGDIVEPETYYPVVPLLAINGSVGIGTGFSTDIPPHNPKEVVGLLKDRLNGTKETLAGVVLNPWWIGFRGSVEQKGDKQWLTRSLYTWHDSTCSVQISELPVGTWTKDYKGFLDGLVQGLGTDAKEDGKPVLKHFDDLYNDVDVNFTLYLEQPYYTKAKVNPEEFEKRFHLTTSWKTTNMCCFDANRNIVKYDTIGTMLEHFYVHRLVAYETRRQHQIATLKDSIEELQAKRDFVKAVVEDRLKLMNQEDEDILGDLQDLGLPPRSDRANPGTLGAFEYLLRMRVDRLKKQSVLDAEKELLTTRQELASLETISASDLWNQELDTFSEAWSSTEQHMLAILRASKETPVASKKKVLLKRSTATGTK